MIEQKEELQGHIVSSGVEITATIIAQKGAKGDPGERGIPGENGYTPVKGIDYFTEADIESLNIPSKISDLTNDSDFVEHSELSSVATTGDYDDLSNKPTIPAKVSDLTNDSGFITNTVNNLTNYYLKSETYNKSEVDTLIANINSFNVEIVQTLPTTDIDLHTIYLVPKNGSSTDVYDEYIYINNSWELIGNTAVDLSNYYTKSETNTLLNAKANSSDLSEVATSGDYDDLLNKPTLSDVISISDNSSSNPFVITENNPGTYVFVDNSVSATGIKMKSTIYIKYKNSSNTLTFNCGYGYLILYDTTEKAYVSAENIGTFVSFSNGSLFYIYTQPEPSGIVFRETNSLSRKTGNDETIYNSWEFISFLPKSSLVPSNDQHLVNKKYVDDNEFSGDYNDLTNKPTIPSKTSDLTNDSGFITGMVELSYGNSTWNDFITAYNAKKIVYCRASSSSNPASGSQTRKAFMAYVNDVDNPTSVEFQYVRSISSHSATQQGDQVFVYTLTSANGGTWEVQTREMSTKIVAGTNMTSSYSNGTLTLNASGGGSSSVDYSTTEQEIGTWINGKPLYRKTLNINIGDLVISGSGYTSIDISSLNTNNLMVDPAHSFVYLIDGSDTYTYSFPEIRIDGSSTIAIVRAGTGKVNEIKLGANGYIELYLGTTFRSGFADGNLILTIEYTKSTD